ncbi:MAG: flagellar assembly peptidoglycan hydrolase FlgJ [Gammaproteobacteria bacterium]|nr:flagellar assembly peptidoglycan hydrolase FlgJ [Gammaproteobacteria bacterium]MCF6230676.1 flagellar assembly peptidoglycan hydrolase FlgJ [Gammaproteobacteria bacterium]
MNAPIQQPQSYTDFQSLTRLRSQARDDAQGALRTVAEQFESIFLGMMVKSMRDASMGDQLFDSNAQNTYLEMYDKELSMSLSSQGGIGLADTIVRQLSQSALASSSAEAAETASPFSLDSLPIQRLTPATSVPPPAVEARKSVEHFATPQQFVESLWPLAQQAADQLGVAPKVLLSQAALETGWGKRIIASSEGESSYNLFNIKADHRWSGPRVTVSTLEYEGGMPVQQRATFRSYGSYAESFQDYADFVLNSPRYGEAVAKAANAEGYIDALHQGGYATDPEYANKIKAIMGRALLTEG